LLSGNIPPELGDLINLEKLELEMNQLSGKIPSELGNLNNLQELYMFTNQLSGSIPLELGNLRNLKSMSLVENELTGSLPPELGNLSNLESLYLQFNQLTGSIPMELGKLSKLYWLAMGSNQLSGCIPPELGNLSNLECLGLSNNKLSGAIPTNLPNLTKLHYLDLRYNCLYTNDDELISWLDSFGQNPIFIESACIYPPSIKITTPNGGERWDVGSDNNITWESIGDVRDVKIEYSTDGGNSWESIALLTPNYGTYSWTVPNTPSSNCKIRVSEASDGDPSDKSDFVFSIAFSPTTPTVTTNAISSITSNSAVCGGSVTSDGGTTVIAKGVCWSIVSFRQVCVTGCGLWCYNLPSL
jgi:hypothetical protein